MNKASWLVLSILLAVCVLVLGNLSSQYWSAQSSLSFLDDGFQKVAAGHTNSPTIPTGQTQEPQKPQASSQTLRNIGESFVVDNIQYTIQSAKDLGNDLSKYGGYGEITNGEYIRVNFKAENVGQQESNLALIAIGDSARRQFTVDIGAIIMTNQNGVNSYNGGGYNPLKPGFSDNYSAIFQVSKVSTGLNFLVAQRNGQIADYVPLGL